MVETQRCKLRGTSDTFVGRVYSIFHLQYGFCELILSYDMVVNTQFHNFYGRSFARVLYFILMNDIAR